VIEGHVPAAAIRRLLDKKPQTRALRAGMPVGSPGRKSKARAPENLRGCVVRAVG